MKIILAGGSGFLGNGLINAFRSSMESIVVLTRGESTSSGNVHHVHWDGKTLGPWTNSLEGADVLINLTGKNVNCRYTEKNKTEILRSRLDSTRVLGKALDRMSSPPALWIQCSSATIYRHSEDKLMDEKSGECGNGFSEQVCLQWEGMFNRQILPYTRKVVLRIGIALGTSGSALPRLINMTKAGFGGRQGNGKQFVSWIHHQDIVRIINWIIENPQANGVYNAVAPQPLANRDFMKSLRKALKVPLGLYMPTWLLSIGAWLIGTETELILKSRKVYPQRLLDNGFVFEFPDLNSALVDLCQPEVKRN